MKTVVIKPPTNIAVKHDSKMNYNNVNIFLAGSIDMGNSEDWQEKVCDYFSKLPTEESRYNCVTLFNPRREEWDNSWEQDITNPLFYQQVNWELNALEKSNCVIVNILPDSKSPITLLELGLFAQSGKLLVCCPNGFYRKGNVDIVCDRYGIPIYNSLEEMLEAIK